MLDTYPAKSASFRWPLVVFQTMLDVTGVNVFAVWVKLFPDWESNRRCRRRKEFLHQLGTEMIMPHIQRRKISSLKNRVINDMKLFVDVERPVAAVENDPKIKRCRVCMETRGEYSKKEKYNSANKVKQRCSRCYQPVCNKHADKVITITCEYCKE